MGANTHGYYDITAQAREQLATRWPETVMPFKDFKGVTVPKDAELVGYDSVSSAVFLKVPQTPMVAVVLNHAVVTFLSADAARAKIALRGYGPEDFKRGGDSDAQ